uniref:Uncharacterized protein n=1 Tax=Eptatretus burgeri TaxID=7764 RepID=A0A8C4QQ95_EPTBU
MESMPVVKDQDKVSQQISTPRAEIPSLHLETLKLMQCMEYLELLDHGTVIQNQDKMSQQISTPKAEVTHVQMESMPVVQDLDKVSQKISTPSPEVPSLHLETLKLMQCMEHLELLEHWMEKRRRLGPFYV